MPLFRRILPAHSLLRAGAAYLVCGLASPAAPAQDDVAAEVEASGKSVRIQRTNDAPVIDGRLDDEAWLRAPVIDDLHQVNPVEFATPSEPTRIYLLYDRNTLYIGVRMFDAEPELINALILRQNQAIGSDDSFFVHIDTFNNRRSGYVFGVNPNGVRYDGIYENLTQRSFDWDGIWQAAAQIDDEGWTVEIAIPFKTLSFDPGSSTWRMNFTRNIERRNESMAWESRNRNTDLSTMGEIRGISQIDQGVGLDVIPTLSVRERKDFISVMQESAVEPSVDVFYKITTSLNAALTVNTDFSATEVDNRQVNLTRFSLFFPERRDFFLQDSDIFEFGRLEQDGRPFFSRTIGISANGQEVPIDYGGRLSGRLGRFDLGALAIRQDAFETVDATTAIVARVAANVLEQSSVGMIYTNGDPQSNLDNSVLGADFRFVNSRVRNGRGAQGEAWIQKTDTEGVRGDDSAFGLALRFPSSTGLNGGLGYTEIADNFNPAMGFVRRTGVRDYEGYVGHTLRPSGGRIRTINTFLNAHRIDYLDTGEVQSSSVGADLINIELNSQDQFSLGYNRSKEGLREPFPIFPEHTIDPGVYEFDTVNLSVRTGNQRKLGIGLFLNDGEFYDGDRFSVGGFFGWRPNRHFRTNVNYQYNDIVFDEVHSITRVVRVNLDVVFSATLAWTNLVQYDNVSDTIGLNSRLHWIPQAGREAYLVLNHNLADFNGDGSYTSAFNEATIKYSYTFRF